MKKGKVHEPTSKPVEVRPDLQDAAKGKDLSYLNEMPQMGRDEGVKAGVPPPPDEQKDKTKKKLKHQ